MNPDLKLALELCDAADAISMARFRATDLRVETKPDMTPVTEADRAIEELIRSRLAATRPGDAIIGEELGASGHAARRWIVDPIDATKSFVRGIPIFGTLIALEENGEITLGAVSAPALKTRWWAQRGEGAYRDGARIQVSSVSHLEDAQVCYASLEVWARGGRAQRVVELAKRSWRTRDYGDFWQHMLVAEGSVEVALEPVVSLWDIAAIKVIVEEAGGRFTDLSGVARADGGDAISSNGLLHDEVLSLITAPTPPG